MFTLKQIEEAHQRVKSGADFPKYIQEIKDFGVESFIVWVKNNITEYFGENNFTINSKPKYHELIISENSDKEDFQTQLKEHQKGVA